MDTIPQDDQPRKRCTKCGKLKSLDDFYNTSAAAQKSPGKQSQCKDCYGDCVKAYQKANPKTNQAPRKKANPDSRRRSKLKTLYNLTPDQYDAMFQAHNGVCAICGMPETVVHQNGMLKRLAVDHDHQTGKIRALLCAKCNADLGLFEKDMDSFLRRREYHLRCLDRTNAFMSYLEDHP